MTEHVFVYGTLKRGYSNNLYCLGHAKRIGEATSLDNYCLFSGGVPFLVDCIDNTGDATNFDATWTFGAAPIRGELYAVTERELANCDRLEGHPYNYRREKRQFRLDNGHTLSAWVYLWQRQIHGDFMHQHEPNEDGVLEWNRDDRRIPEPKSHAPKGYACRDGYRKIAVSFPEAMFNRLCKMVEDSNGNKTFSEVVEGLITRAEFSDLFSDDAHDIPAKAILPADVKPERKVSNE